MIAICKFCMKTFGTNEIVIGGMYCLSATISGSGDNIPDIGQPFSKRRFRAPCFTTNHSDV